MNHKWQKEIEYEYGTKPHRCTMCGIRKMWRGGDYQAWEYIWNTSALAINGSEHFTTHKSWHRPDCKLAEKQPKETISATISPNGVQDKGTMD